jgi:hypothetical protein
MWMAAVRDHPDRPPSRQFLVLACLALRMNWRTGTGYASGRTLGKDADCGASTVGRATAWARKHDLLVMEERGHRLTDESVKATRWRLRLPSQQVTRDTLGSGPTGQWRHPNRSMAASQPVSPDPLSRPSTSRPTSSRAGARAAGIIRAAYPDATDDEIKTITKDRTGHGARDLAAVLAHEAREGALRLPCDRAGPGGHSEACRNGDSGRCGMDWCECRCHTPAATP